MAPSSILLIDNQTTRRRTYQGILHDAGFQTTVATEESLAFQLQQEHALYLVIPPITPQQTHHIQQHQNETPLLLLHTENTPPPLNANLTLQPPINEHQLLHHIHTILATPHAKLMPEQGQLETYPIRTWIEDFAFHGTNGTLSFITSEQRGQLFFREGRLLGALYNQHQGFEALLRTLRLQQGQYQIRKEIPQNDDEVGIIERSHPLRDALETLQQWDQLLQQLPPSNEPMQVQFQHVQQAFSLLRELSHNLLWQLASQRTIEQILADTNESSIHVLQELVRLYEQQFYTLLVEETTMANDSNSRHDKELELLSKTNIPPIAQNSDQQFGSLLATAAQEAARYLVAASEATPATNPSGSSSMLDLSTFDLDSLSTGNNRPSQSNKDEIFSVPNDNPLFPSTTNQTKQDLPTELGFSSSQPPQDLLPLDAAFPNDPPQRVSLFTESHTSNDAFDAAAPMTQPDLPSIDSRMFIERETAPPTRPDDLFTHGVIPPAAPPTSPDTPPTDLNLDDDEIIELPSSARKDAPTQADEFDRLLEAESNQALDKMLQEEIAIETFSSGNLDAPDGDPLSGLLEISEEGSLAALLEPSQSELDTPPPPSKQEEEEEEEEPLLLTPASPREPSSIESIEELAAAHQQEELETAPIRLATSPINDHSPIETMPFGITIKTGKRPGTLSSSSFRLDPEEELFPDEESDSLDLQALSLQGADEEINSDQLTDMRSSQEIRVRVAEEDVQSTGMVSSSSIDSLDELDEDLQHALSSASPEDAAEATTQKPIISLAPPDSRSSEDLLKELGYESIADDFEEEEVSSQTGAASTSSGSADEANLETFAFVVDPDALEGTEDPKLNNLELDFFELEQPEDNQEGSSSRGIILGLLLLIGIFALIIIFNNQRQPQKTTIVGNVTTKQRQAPPPARIENLANPSPESRQANAKNTTAATPPETRNPQEPNARRTEPKPQKTIKQPDARRPKPKQPGTRRTEPKPRRTIKQPPRRKKEEAPLPRFVRKAPKRRIPESAPLPRFRKPTPRRVAAAPPRVEPKRPAPPTLRPAEPRQSDADKGKALAAKLIRRARRTRRSRTRERLYRRALKADPSNVGALVGIGNLLYQRNKGNAALRYLEKAYNISPRQTYSGLVTLGSIYYEKNQIAKAKRVYQQYARYYPKGRNIEDVKSMLQSMR